MTAETNERRVSVPELKPCPFCGDIPESAVNETEDIWHLNVTCPVSMTIFSQKDWNSRAAPAAPKPEPDDAFDFRAHLQRQREWSEKTFGPGARTTGVLDHIRKELIEVEREPSDLSEWIDVVILALDGAWRAGHQPEQIIAALVAKQTKNESRNWPDWKTAAPDKAIEHVREPDDKLRVQACRPEDRAMLATDAGAELLAAVTAEMRKEPDDATEATPSEISDLSTIDAGGQLTLKEIDAVWNTVLDGIDDPVSLDKVFAQARQFVAVSHQLAKTEALHIELAAALAGLDKCKAELADLRHDMERLYEADSEHLKELADERAKVADHATYVRIAELIGSIFVFGEFKAETANERELKGLLLEVGCFYENVLEFEAKEKK